MAGCPDELRRIYRQQRVLPFVGAGVSMSVKWMEGEVECRGVSWRELVNQAMDMLGFNEPDLLRFRGSNLQILEYFRVKHGSLAPLTNWLFTAMNPDDASLKCTPILTQIAKLDKCTTIYTTNYDNFIERSLKLAIKDVNVIVSEKHMGTHVGANDVVKFHGDFNNPEKMVMSKSHYERRIRLDDELDARLRSDILGRAVLFIGYSFPDSNVSCVFPLINDTFKKVPNSDTGKRAYIVIADPSDFEIKLFLDRNVEVIPISGANSEEDISTILMEHHE